MSVKSHFFYLQRESTAAAILTILTDDLRWLTVISMKQNIVNDPISRFIRVQSQYRIKSSAVVERSRKRCQLSRASDTRLLVRISRPGQPYFHASGVGELIPGSSGKGKALTTCSSTGHHMSLYGQKRIQIAFTTSRRIRMHAASQNELSNAVPYSLSSIYTTL